MEGDDSKINNNRNRNSASDNQFQKALANRKQLKEDMKKEKKRKKSTHSKTDVKI